jgi:hypothetical protein
MTVDYNSTFTVKKASLKLSGLNLSEITLVPKNADTLFKIKNKNKRQLVAATYRRCAVGNSRSSKWLCPASKENREILMPS